MRPPPRSGLLWGGLLLGSLLLVGVGALSVRFMTQAHSPVVRSPVPPRALAPAPAPAQSVPRPRSFPLARRAAEAEWPSREPELEPSEPPEALSGELAALPAEDRDLGVASVPSGAIAPDFRAPDPPPPMPFDPDDE
jgi:hypothetical protein